ncbi:expressed unknown protein [Seminavis robusta]|uniref:Uncharacterized protein n=1 Tax=Seminavis robusta TaxID=568900 RepID=A0A9N8HG28_9STRA|nr:expressed unknown protein [Seminavis robusta]|eukprot:Sro608_g174770.1 n/a (205) ;mRNA; f:9129-9911
MPKTWKNYLQDREIVQVWNNGQQEQLLKKRIIDSIRKGEYHIAELEDDTVGRHDTLAGHGRVSHARRHYCSPCMRGNLLLALRFLCDTELKSELVSGHDFGWFLAWQDDNNQENYLVHIFTFQPYHEVKFFLVGGPEHDTVDVMRAWKGEEEEQSTTLESSSSRPLVRPGGLIDSDDDDDDDDLEIVPRNNPTPAARLFDEEDE